MPTSAIEFVSVQSGTEISNVSGVSAPLPVIRARYTGPTIRFGFRMIQPRRSPVTLPPGAPGAVGMFDYSSSIKELSGTSDGEVV